MSSRVEFHLAHNVLMCLVMPSGRINTGKQVRHRMKSISLTVPFMVLSTKINQSGDMEKHVLTPFGDIDISFRVALQGPARRAHYEVEVEGDIEHWVLDADLMEEFRRSLLDFIRGISRECLQYFRGDADEMKVRFKGNDFNVTASWLGENSNEQNQSPTTGRAKEISH